MKKWLSLFLCLALLAALPAARAEGALQAQDSDFTNSTVERVKSEILSAQITSSAEVLSVALDHLDADITVDGMTTTILDDGRLQITQILSPDNADEIAAHSGAAAGASDMACSTLLVVGPNGEEASSGSFEMEDSGGLNEYSVYAVHTAYFDLYEESFFDPIEVRTTKLSTKFTYGTSIRATSFYHAYMVEVGHYPETVVLLSKLNTKQHVEVELNLDELDLTAAESKATYEEIKAYVLEKFGLKVSSLYISQVKRKCGLDVGQNYNLPKKENAKVPQCPPEKEAAIMEALKHFQMLE